MTEKKVIIFDVDGVLFDTVDLMHERTFFEYPTMTLEEAKDLHSRNIFQSLKDTSHKKREQTEDQFQSFLSLYAAKKSQALLYKDIKDFLDKIREKNILVVNTSTTEENCFPMFEREGIKNFFDYFATKELSPNKVEKFNYILEKYKVTVKDVVFITDTLGDLKEAYEIGIPTIAVTWGVHEKESFYKENYSNLILVVDTVSDLEKFILAL